MNTEQHRHECEVRHVAKMTTNADRARYLAGVGKERGEDAAERLRRDVWRVILGAKK